MTDFVFVIIFALSCSVFCCQGAITSPPHGKKYLFLPGETAKIKWEIDDPVSAIQFRTWSYMSSEGATPRSLARIVDDNPTESRTKLFNFTIERPATLVLNNVNQSYNGLYEFSYSAPGTFSSQVDVSIANAPTVNLSCPSPSEVNKGDNITFVCRGVGGVPPANVTWYKDGVQISETKKENNTLNLYDVNGTHSGNYTCVAQSYPTEAFKDEKSCELKVLSKPYDTTITFNPQPVIVGDSVEIVCESKGFPVPHFNIIRNGETIKTGKSHTIQVNQSDERPYTCNAINALGNDSATDNLITVTESTQTPKPTTIKPSPTQNIVSSAAKRKGNTTQPRTFTVSVPTPSREPKSDETVWFIVIMSLLGVVIIGILLSYIVWRSCRKFRSSKHQSNPEPQTTEVDPTYQGLELNKMNKEDNYQSLTGNYAASNDVGTEDESAYTELKKIRDVEDQYQSLQ